MNENPYNIEELDTNTILAIQRTVLANTRTFAAWVRTGLSSVLAGFGIVKFMGNNDKYQAFVSSIGILFVIIGIGIYIYGYSSYKISYRRLVDRDKHNLSIPLYVSLFITIGLIITSLFIIFLLILFK